LNAELAETADILLCGLGVDLCVVAGSLLCVCGMSQSRIELGKTGEDLACDELERRGYAIVARRHRCRTGELDIVARDGPTLVFVEVKARGGRAFGDAAEAVTWHKQQRIVRLASEYVMRHHLNDAPCRFDVVSVQFEDNRPVIEVFQNAFSS
jgi:putative endonuclease